MFGISLAQWSLNRSFFGGIYDPIDFARIARGKFGIEAIEYVNQFYFDTLDDKLVKALRERADDEGVISNLFFFSHGKMHTPALDRAGVEGVMRQRVIEHLQQLDIPLEMGRFYPDLLLQASECFMCNSVYGVRPIKAIGEQGFATGPVSQALIGRLNPVARTG